MAAGLDYTVYILYTCTMHSYTALVHCTRTLHTVHVQRTCQALLIRPVAPAISLWSYADNLVTLLYNYGQYSTVMGSTVQLWAVQYSNG